MHNPNKSPRKAVGVSLSDEEKATIRRLAAEEAARQGRPIAFSEFIRLRTIGPDIQQDRAA